MYFLLGCSAVIAFSCKFWCDHLKHILTQQQTVSAPLVNSDTLCRASSDYAIKETAALLDGSVYIGQKIQWKTWKPIGRNNSCESRGEVARLSKPVDLSHALRGRVAILFRLPSGSYGDHFAHQWWHTLYLLRWCRFSTCYHTHTSTRLTFTWLLSVLAWSSSRFIVLIFCEFANGDKVEINI